MITGGVVDLFWYSMKSYGGVFSIYEIIPGFIASSIAIVIFSLTTKLPKEIADEFEESKKPWVK
ncbi:MAG: hypothetical protein ACOX4V_07295 [Anaerovoracaceae bacterium]